MFPCCDRAGPRAASGRPVVCHVSTVHPTHDKRIFYRECLPLVRAGYEVHLVVRHDRDEVVEGVHIHGLPVPPNRLYRVAFWPYLAYRKVLSIRPRPAIVHFHDPELLPMGQALRLKGIKPVFDSHENVAATIEGKHYLPAALRWPLARLYEVGEAFLTSGMGVVAVIDGMAARYREPRVVVRNLPNLRVSPKPVPKVFAPPWKFVYGGYITPTRGGLRMLQLMADLQGRGVAVEFLMFGFLGEEWWIHKLRDFIAAHDLRDCVTLRGEVPVLESIERMSAAQVGLCLYDPIPNFTNGLPVKGFEYMSQGLVSIASNFECYKPVFVDTGAGVLVDPLDREAILETTLDLLGNPRRMEEMSRRGQEAIRDRLNMEAESRRLFAFYDRLLGRKAPVQP